MKLVSLSAFVLALAACANGEGALTPSLKIEFEISGDRMKGFIDIGTNFANSAALDVEGPEARPGTAGDDYVVVLRARSGFHITMNTDAATKTGSVYFYCSGSRPDAKASGELKQIAQRFIRFMEADPGILRVRGYSGGRSNDESQERHGPNETLDEFVETAVRC